MYIPFCCFNQSERRTRHFRCFSQSERLTQKLFCFNQWELGWRYTPPVAVVVKLVQSVRSDQAYRRHKALKYAKTVYEVEFPLYFAGREGMHDFFAYFGRLTAARGGQWFDESIWHAVDRITRTRQTYRREKNKQTNKKTLTDPFLSLSVFSESLGSL